MSYTGITINNVADGETAWLCYCLPAATLNRGGGNIGQRVGYLELYKWGTFAPTTYPQGSSTYTWADGTFTLPATTNGWSLTPGSASAGQTLWGISVIISDSAATSTSTVTWPTANIVYPLTYAAVATTRTAILDVYRWSSTGAPTTFPSGTSTYTWSSGQFTAPTTPNSWSLTPGSFTIGQTLYIARQIYSDSGSSTTTSVTWNTATAANAGADTTTGFRIFKEITELPQSPDSSTSLKAVYYQDITDTPPIDALITLAATANVTVDNTVIKSSVSSFSMLQGKESQLVKVGNKWCILNKYINDKAILVDRPITTAGDVQIPRYYPDIINDIIVGKITRVGSAYSLEPYFTVKSENNSPVEFVTSLPTVGNYAGRTVVLSTDNLIYSWSGTEWVQGSPSTITESATAPTSPSAGSLWFRTTDSIMFLWNGTQWVQTVTGLTGTRSIDITTITGVYNGETVLDTNSNQVYSWDANALQWNPVLTDAVTVDLTNEAHTIACLSDGTPVGFTGAETLIKVFSGQTNVTNLWTITPSATGVTGSLTTADDGISKKYTVTAISQDQAYVDFSITRTGYVTRQARFTVTKVKSGAAGGGGVNYRLDPSVGGIKQNTDGTYTPSTITFYGWSISGTSAPVAYSGRFKIYTSTNGTTFTLQDQSTADETSRTYTIPSSVKYVKGELY
ncbi:hypothetical protein EB077_12135, partial [bacterium]|nr:hypothetical protein [bacterium]